MTKLQRFVLVLPWTLLSASLFGAGELSKTTTLFGLSMTIRNTR